MAQTVKRLTTMRETGVQSLSQEDLLGKEMATHSSILACKIPWTEEPGRLQSMWSQRVGHGWATSLHFTSLHFKGDSWEKTEGITKLLEWALQNIAVYISIQSVGGVCVCVEKDLRKDILMYYKELAFVIAGTRLASWKSTEKVSKRSWVL